MTEALYITSAIITIVLGALYLPKLIHWLRGIYGQFYHLKDFPPRKSSYPIIKHTKHGFKNKLEGDTSFDQGFVFLRVYYGKVYVYGKSGGRLSKKQKKDLNKTVQRIMDFHDTKLSPFPINLESSDGTHTATSTKELFKKLLDKVLKSNTPSSVIIHGRIGCGKSTLISSITHELLFTDRHHSGQIRNLPIYIDVREDLKDALQRIISEKDMGKNEVHEILSESIISQIQKQLQKNNIQIANPNNLLESIIETLNTKLFRLVVCIDELDTVYYDFCRAWLTPNEIHYKKIDRFKYIIDYFLQITTKDLPSGLYSSTVFILSLRETSHALFNFRNQIGELIKSGSIHTIKMRTESNEHLLSILTTRLKVKIQWLKQTKDHDTEILRKIEGLYEAIQSGEVDYTKNIELSVHGLRHILNLFHKIDSYDKSSQLLTALLKNPNELLLIYQFLDGSYQYSQAYEGVSNIFLVNKDGKLALLRDTTRYPNAEIDDVYLSDHLQTYLLKYYVLYYIWIKSRNGGEGTTITEIHNIFCNDVESKDYTVYEEEITSLILLHATEADHGRLIRLRVTDNCEPSQIVTTRRANRMFEESTFFTFAYMMVIIEDAWLGFPPFLTEAFRITKDCQRSVEFVLKHHTLTEKQKVDFIKYKATLVQIFCILLEESEKYESLRYKHALKQLKTALGDPDLIPVTRDIGIEVKADIIQFSQRILNKTTNAEIIRDHLEQFNRMESANYRRKISDHFEKYHGGKMNRRGIGEMMEAYHRSRI